MASIRFEYRHVRFDYGLLAAVDSRAFDESLTSLLNNLGDEGWELKGCFHDFGAHAHLVFCRPVPQDPESVVVRRPLETEELEGFEPVGSE